MNGAAPCYDIEAAVVDVWPSALHRGMLNMLTAPALTLMFLIVVTSLGSALVWMFWEIEQTASRLRRMSRPHRKSDHFE